MASDLKAAAAAIRTRFADEWQAARGYTDAQLAARVEFEGTKFGKPDAEWARLTILWGNAFVDTMNGRNVAVGVVSVQVFVQPGNGTGALEGYCDDVRDIFSRKELSGATYMVRFDAASAPRPTPDDDGWLVMLVDVPFTAEETI